MSRCDEAWGRYRLMCAIDNPEPIERAFREAWERQDRLIATVYERVACPKCVAEVGVPCRDLRPGKLGNTKYPHRERLRAAGISER